METSTSTPCENQIIGRYCPATLTSNKKYVVLHYVPRNLRIINTDTSLLLEENKKNKNVC